MKKQYLDIFLFILCLILFQREGLAASYKKVLKQHTRSDRVYRVDDLHAAIEWSATYLSDEMIGAQAWHRAKKYQLSNLEKEEVLEDLKAKQDHRILFFISFYGGDRQTRDLSNPKSDWDLRLTVGSNRYQPMKIEKISKPTPLDYFYYPTLHPWAMGYYVWFDLSPYFLTRSSLKLELHGPFSHSTLQFD